MFLTKLFRPKRSVSPSRRQRICNEVAEQVELPELGIVEVRCRISCEGEGCPKPQLLTLKALNESPGGTVVEVITDNPSAVETIPSMMDIYGGRHLATTREAGHWHIYVLREQ